MGAILRAAALSAILTSTCYRGIALAPYRHPQEDFARVAVHELFEVYYERSLRPPRVVVHWSFARCPKWPDQIGVWRRGHEECLSGLHYSCDEIYVAFRPAIGASAYAHELAHCYRYEVEGDADGTHADSRYWQWVTGIEQALAGAEKTW